MRLPDPPSRILALLDAGTPFVLATVVVAQGAPAGSPQLGQKLIVHADGAREGTLGTDGLDEAVAAAAGDVLRTEQVAVIRLSPTGEPLRRRLGLRQLGTDPVVEVALEPMLPVPALVIVGAGHIGTALARLGKLLGFHVTVLDDRESFANRERFPDADQIIAANFAEGLSRVPMTPWTYVVLVTRGHEHDEACLRLVVESPVPYIGMIGSQRRVRLVFQRLQAADVSPEKLKRVYAPIGLDLNARTPDEIAVAIIAEIINVRRRGNARSLAISRRKATATS